MEAKHYVLSQMPQDHPVAKIDRRRIIGDRMMVAEITLHKGFVVPTHRHESEQICVMISGTLRFGIGEEGSADRYEVVIHGGDVLQLPPNIPHSAEALEECRLFDLFSPVELTMGVDQHSQP